MILLELLPTDSDQEYILAHEQERVRLISGGHDWADRCPLWRVG
jgi:hypothetical protein